MRLVSVIAALDEDFGLLVLVVMVQLLILRCVLKYYLKRCKELGYTYVNHFENFIYQLRLLCASNSFI